MQQTVRWTQAVPLLYTSTGSTEKKHQPFRPLPYGYSNTSPKTIATLPGCASSRSVVFSPKRDVQARTDRTGKTKRKTYLGTLQGHRARGLGEPLVPADRHSYLSEERVENLEARVTRVEVELFLCVFSPAENGNWCVRG